MGSRPAARLALWCLLGLALLSVRLGLPLRPAIAYDSFQYLSAAEQVRNGSVGRTSIVHFDAERSFGTLPAPLVTFPMGLPLALAAVSALGVPAETAGALISAGAFILTLMLLWGLTGRAGLSGSAQGAAMLLTVMSGALLQFAATVSTELLFTLVITTGFVLLARAHATPERLGLWSVAGLVLGASYHVRYAGLFLVAGLGPVMAWQFVIARDRRRALGVTVAGLTATAVVAVGFARNIMLVGNWRGGNEKVVTHPLGEVLVESVRATHGLTLGPGWGPIGLSLPLRLAFLLACVAGLAWLIHRRTDDGPTRPAVDTALLRDLAMLVAVYCAGMMYAALTSVISYGTRMFVPLVPVLALLAVGAVQALAGDRLRDADRRRLVVGSRVLLGAYVAINLTSFGRPLVDRISAVRSQLDATVAGGRSVRSVLNETLGAEGVLLANNGQAVGYALGRPTLSLVGPRYSVVEWDEAALREVIERFRVSAVVITAPNAAQPDDADLIGTPFIRALANGEAPSWLRPLGRVGPMTVYLPSIRSLEP